MTVAPGEAASHHMGRLCGPQEQILRATINDHTIVCEDMRDTVRTSTCLNRVRDGLCLNNPRTLRENENLQDALMEAPDHQGT